MCNVLESFESLEEVAFACASIPSMAKVIENCPGILPDWNSPIFRDVLSASDVKNAVLRRWLKHKILKTCIVPAQTLFPNISSRIVVKAARDERSISVTWELVCRASLFGFGAREFHQACDGKGKYVVVRAENGRIAVAYNEDGSKVITAILPIEMGSSFQSMRMDLVEFNTIEIMGIEGLGFSIVQWRATRSKSDSIWARNLSCG
jgi:hypothetical protein